MLRARLPLLSGPLEALVVANLPVSGPGWKWSHVPRSQEKGARVKRRKSRLRRTRANQAARIRAWEVRDAVRGGWLRGGGRHHWTGCCTGVYKETVILRLHGFSKQESARRALALFLGNRENTTRILSRKSLEMLALFLPRAIFFLASRTYLSGATRMRGEPNFSWRRCFSDKKREILLFFSTTPTAEKKKSQKPILFKTDHLRVTRHRIQCASQTSPRRHTLAPAAVA